MSHWAEEGQWQPEQGGCGRLEPGQVRKLGNEDKTADGVCMCACANAVLQPSFKVDKIGIFFFFAIFTFISPFNKAIANPSAFRKQLFDFTDAAVITSSPFPLKEQ